ncbi:MAG: hypothetical protein OXC91_11500 [Rhodobacteraceae bacterium]|nr:hypothetical protein [Paracoccaceae bacterium]
MTRSKTDPTGQGAIVAVTEPVMADLAHWAALQGAERTGSVFGMSDRHIARRLAAGTQAAGLGTGFRSFGPRRHGADDDGEWCACGGGCPAGTLDQ